MSSASGKAAKAKKKTKPSEHQPSPKDSEKESEEEFTIHPTVEDYQSLDSSNEDRMNPQDDDESIVFTRCADLGVMQTDEVNDEYRRKGARPKIKSAIVLPAEQLHGKASANEDRDIERVSKGERMKKTSTYAFNPKQSGTDIPFSKYLAPPNNVSRSDLPPKVYFDTTPIEPNQLRGYFGDHVEPQTRNMEHSKRSIYIAGMERLWTNSNHEEFLTLPSHAIKCQIDQTNKYWERFLQEHSDAYRQSKTIDEDNHLCELHGAVEALHTRIITKRCTRAEELSADLHNSSYNDASSLPMSNHRRQGTDDIRVERVSLETFDGNIEKWNSFKSYFQTYFIVDKYTDGTKMYYLRKSLLPDSEPFNHIKGLEPTGEFFQVAWQRLCDEYDDDRRVLIKTFTKFLELPKVGNPPTRSELTALVTGTKNMMESMPRYGFDVSTLGTVIVSILERKLDRKTKSV